MKSRSSTSSYQMLPRSSEIAISAIYCQEERNLSAWFMRRLDWKRPRDFSKIFLATMPIAFDGANEAMLTEMRQKWKRFEYSYNHRTLFVCASPACTRVISHLPALARFQGIGILWRQRARSICHLAISTYYDFCFGHAAGYLVDYDANKPQPHRTTRPATRTGI